jgi:hypothetical protein
MVLTLGATGGPGVVVLSCRGRGGIVPLVPSYTVVSSTSVMGSSSVDKSLSYSKGSPRWGDESERGRVGIVCGGMKSVETKRATRRLGANIAEISKPMRNTYTGRSRPRRRSFRHENPSSLVL